MAFNFDESIDRRHSDSYKWQKYSAQDVIPLWVADTDFRSPPCIIEALQARVAHGIFGYGAPPKDLAELLVARMSERYHWHIEPDWLVFLPGLVSGLNLAVRALTQPGESVVIPSPIYPPFRGAARGAGREQRLAPMRLDRGRWLVDLSGLPAGMDGTERLLMLCNPHNPGGTVYRRAELEQQLNFARRHDLSVCSDEIHCDVLLEPGVEHIPFGSLNDDAAQRSITLVSPSKSFNIAGLGASAAIIPNARLRSRFTAQRSGIVPNVDILALVAAAAAWRDGQPWLTEQLDYLRGNRDWLAARLASIPELRMTIPQATYLAWIDATALGVDNPQHFFEQAGVGLSPGADFGDRHFIRLNFGCPRPLLVQAVERMARAIVKLNSRDPAV
ncbi:PatB family C-S lyase [Acerihabitans sp. TG2]|uniref:MalY/PatB family protein n=1 Tax=Acerihabitans sp. TG2 TaxID=3096008 RepID=UPI002B237BA1|nr:PatB family C-S lyase [Acerihabitans sp. TG2]MEA9392960.1 PatB family C-S lyase [Acerihabitans sp. TG2]